MGIVKMAETKKTERNERKRKERRKEKNKKKKKPSSSSKNDSSKTDVDVSFESESEEDSEKPTRKQPKKGVKIMESRKRKQILEDSSSESKSESINETETETETIEECLRQGQQGVSIQVCILSSQSTSESPVPTFEPSPQQREPQKVDESTPTMPPTPSKMDPAPEATTAALLMMAKTASYVPKELPLPSFSLGLTDSSQEETQMQEGVEQAEAQVIVTAMCLILNQQNIKRFQEEIYCLPPNIVNMAIGNHPNGEFLQPKSKKPFKVEDYPMFLPFLDRKKLASHPYAEVDHYRVEFASRILFHDMNHDRDAAIKGSEIMRLSKPSAALLSQYCQLDSYDIESVSD
ncbi:hypothetical protein AHAS_Ahas03G0193600 [Arachis hypogaea]